MDGVAVRWLGGVLCVSLGGGGLGRGVAVWVGVRGDWKKSCRITWQLLVPISADILRSLTWKKSTFYLKKKQKKSPIKKKCLDFSFCTHSLFFYLKCAPCSFVPLISLVFNPSFFTRSRLRRPRLRTPDALRQCPWGRCPQWAGERSSVIYTPSPSCPTVLCVSAPREEKHNGC